MPSLQKLSFILILLYTSIINSLYFSGLIKPTNFSHPSNTSSSILTPLKIKYFIYRNINLFKKTKNLGNKILDKFSKNEILSIKTR